MDTIIPQLHEAARNNEVDRTNDLLRRFEYAPHMALLANGLTPAHVAALSGSVDVLKALVEFSSKDREFVATAEDKQGLTVLHYAALGGDPEVVEFLLTEFGHSATYRNNNGGLPIHFAAGAGHLDVLRRLINHTGAHLTNDKDNTGTTPPYFAAQEGHLDCLKYLCIEAYADKLSRAGDGMTTLHGATQGGHFETVKWIVQQMGPRVMEDRADDGATPVHFAAASGHDDILAYFLQQGRSDVLVTCKDNENATPAHDAVEYGHLNSLKILIQFDADLNIEDDEGESPYSLAVSRPSDDSINIFVTEYTRLSPFNKPHHHQLSSSSSIVSDRKTPKTSKQEATEIKLASNQALEFLTFKTKQKRELQSAARESKEKKKAQKKDSLEATKNRLLAYNTPHMSPQSKSAVSGGKRRSRSHENVLEDQDISLSEFTSRSKPHSHARHKAAHNYRRPYGYIHPEDVLLDKFVTQGFGVPPPPLKNLKHAKRVDLSQVSLLVKRRESIRTKRDVILYRKKQLELIKQQTMSNKKILKYEDIQKKLSTPVHVTDTFEPPAPPITLSSQLDTEGRGWDQFIETDSNPDSVDERYNIAAGIEIATLALLAPSCLSAFGGVLPFPEDTFVAVEGRSRRKGKGIKLGKMQQRQIAPGGGANEEDSDQSDDPFIYDDIEARRHGWDEPGASMQNPARNLIGGDVAQEPGEIIASRDRHKGRKKLSMNIGKRLNRSKQKISDSQSEGSIASYASDGDLQREMDLEPGNEVPQTESFEAPKFASAVKKVGINSEQPDHLAATFTPQKSEVRVEVNEKYFNQPIRPKSKTAPISDAEIQALVLPPPSPGLKLEPTVKFQIPDLVAKESNVLKPTMSGVSRTTESRRKNASVPHKQQSTTPVVVTKTNKITLPSSSSESTLSGSSDQLIQFQTGVEVSSGGVADKVVSQSNDELDAILQELDLIGLDLQMELENISTVTSPPSKPRDTSRHKNVPTPKSEPKISKPEPRISKPEPRISKSEPKISKPEPKISKPEPKISKPEPRISKSEPKISKPDPRLSKLELEPIKSAEKREASRDLINNSPVSKIRTETRSSQSDGGIGSSGETKGRSRGVRLSPGLKLSYNAEFNYPDSAVSLNTDGSSIVSSGSKLSKQESDLHSHIEKHTLLVDQAASASSIYSDKQKDLQTELSRVDDLIRKRSLAYEQAQTHLRKVSVSTKESQIVDEAKKRVSTSHNSLQDAKNRQENIKQQIALHVQQLDELEKTIEQMKTFKVQQAKLLDQIEKKGVEADKPLTPPIKQTAGDLIRRPSLSATKGEVRVATIERQDSNSSSETELIPPAESWKLVSSHPATATATNTDTRDTIALRSGTMTPELRSGQCTPRTLELIEATRGHISIASLKRRGEKRDSSTSIGAIQEHGEQLQEPASGKKSSSSLFPKEEFCVVCQLRVYPMEKYISDGKVLHQTCLKCSVCKQRVTTKEFKLRNNRVFCNNHLPS